MQTQESIEFLLESELFGLCASCSNADYCVYRKTTEKIIIQCQMYEPRKEVEDRVSVTSEPRGLCMNCALARLCQLPGRTVGVWHCEEYI